MSRLGRLRRCTAFGLSLLVLAVAGGVLAPMAAADGDPASDVLLGQTVFLPTDSGATAAQEAQLEGTVAAATRAGYPIRVAVIATPADLGSVGELWRQPQSYAPFLGVELSLVYHGMLLVAMPNGFGVYEQGRSVSAQRAALASLPAPGARDLVGGAISGVERLAAAAGHPVQASSASAPTAGVGGGDAGTWIAFVIGLALIVAAWTASFRARPPRLRTQ